MPHSSRLHWFVLWVLLPWAVVLAADLSAQTPTPSSQSGDALPARALLRFGTNHWRHGSAIQCLIFSNDALRIAGGGGNDPVRIWDAASGTEIRQLPEPWVRAMVFSRRGGQLVTGGALQIIRIWDMKEGKEVAQLPGHKAAITALALSADNSLLASGGADGMILLWEISLKGITQIAQFPGHTDEVTSLTFSPDQDSIYLASGSKDRTVRIWHTDQKKMLWQKSGGGTVATVAFVNDTLFASAGDDKKIHLWNAADGQEAKNLDGHPAALVGLAAAHDGKSRLLVASGAEGALHIWDVAAGKKLRTVARHAGDGEALTMSRDGQLVACGGGNNTIRLFETATGKERSADAGLQAGLAGLALAPDGKTVASISSTGTITVWDRASAKAIRSWETGHHGEAILAFTPDGSLLASGSREQPVRFWDPKSGKESFQLRAKQGDHVLALAFAPQGNLLAIGYRFGPAEVWEWKQKKVLFEAKLPSAGGVQAAAFSTDSRLLALGGFGKIALWDVPQGKEIRVVDSKADAPNPDSLPAVAALAFSSDGKTLAAGCFDGVIRLIDHQKGKEVRALEGHGSVAYSLAFSRDGRILVSGSFDKSVRLWESFSGLTIAALPGHRGPVNAVALSADGRVAFSASSDTSILAWDVTGRAHEGFEPSKTAVDFESAWRDLASEDTVRGHQALWGLVVHGATSVPYLGKQLYLIDPTRIDQLFKDLGDKSFNVRLKASKELERYGRWMEGRFKEALVNPPDLEVQRRIEQMLAKLTGGLTIEQERIRVRRVMLILEQLGTPEARQVLQSLVDGAPEVELQGEAKLSLERLGNSK